MEWSISLAARAFDPEQVQNSTLEQLALYTYPTSFMDTGPPAAFQIDGNFGAPAGTLTPRDEGYRAR